MTQLEMLATEMISGLETAILSLNAATGGLGLIVYILQALALYTIAERRGIKKSWLAWIPLVNVWILGSVSDQYQYVVNGQVKNKRKVLLGLNIAIAVIDIAMVVGLIWVFIDLFALGLSAIPYAWDTMALYMINKHIGTLLVMLLLCIPLVILGVVQTVFFYMALYDVFRSCDSQNSTLYLVLSLVGNLVVEGVYAIFLMLCKDKDLGMPPRKAESTPEEPVCEQEDSQ